MFWCFTPLFLAVFMRFFFIIFNFIYETIIVLILGIKYADIITVIAFITSLFFTVAACSFLWKQYKKHILESWLCLKYLIPIDFIDCGHYYLIKNSSCSFLGWWILVFRWRHESKLIQVLRKVSYAICWDARFKGKSLCSRKPAGKSPKTSVQELLFLPDVQWR